MSETKLPVASRGSFTQLSKKIDVNRQVLKIIRILLALVPLPTCMRSLQVPAERVHRVVSG